MTVQSRPLTTKFSTTVMSELSPLANHRVEKDAAGRALTQTLSGRVFDDASDATIVFAAR
jgi:hypothetical protein